MKGYFYEEFLRKHSNIKACIVVGWEVYSIFMHGRSRMTIWYRPSHPYYAGTDHAGFSPTRQTLLAPSAKHGEVFGESHEGYAASYWLGGGGYPRI